MKNKAGSVAIEEFVGLNSKLHSIMVDDSSEHKKAKGVNENIVARITHKKYKCLRHLINRMQSKDHKKETSEIKKKKIICHAFIIRYVS